MHALTQGTQRGLIRASPPVEDSLTFPSRRLTSIPVDTPARQSYYHPGRARPRADTTRPSLASALRDLIHSSSTPTPRSTTGEPAAAPHPPQGAVPHPRSGSPPTVAIIQSIGYLGTPKSTRQLAVLVPRNHLATIGLSSWLRPAGLGSTASVHNSPSH